MPKEKYLNRSKSKKGFTLMELVLVTGIVSFIAVGIFSSYQSRHDNQLAKQVTEEITALNSNINFAYSTVGGLSALSATTAIAGNLVPESLILSNGNIGFGGVSANMTLTQASIPGSPSTPAYTLSVGDLNSKFCNRLATSNLATYSASYVHINGTQLKTPLTNINDYVKSIAVNCTGSPTYTLNLTYKIFIPPSVNSGELLLARDKENSFYISTVADETLSSAPVYTCTGGATWRDTFCSCPTNTMWDGNQCSPFNSSSSPAGWCPLGQGWIPGTKVCGNLPNGSSSGQYVDGRYLPSVVDSTFATRQNIYGGQKTPGIGTESFGGRTISWGVGNVDPKTVQVCINGAWNASRARCETP